MRIKVKPAPGLIVRDPDSREALPEEGKEVNDSSFWQRRIRSGDCLLVEEKEEKPKKTKGGES